MKKVREGAQMMNPPKQKYPECDKWGAVHKQATTIRQFLEWMGQRDYSICEIPKEYETTFCQIRFSYQQLIEQYFEIDAAKLDDERRQMLAEAGLQK